MTRRKTLDRATLRRLAVAAEADPDTVKDEWERPDRLHNVARQRIRRALREAGLIGDGGETPEQG